MVSKIQLLMMLPAITLVALIPATYASNGAVVINGVSCGFLDGNGNAVTADASHVVITSSGHGTLTCKGTGVPNDSGRAVQYDFSNTGGSTCTVGTPDLGYADTDKWHETISADGQATLVCQLK